MRNASTCVDRTHPNGQWYAEGGKLSLLLTIFEFFNASRFERIASYYFKLFLKIEQRLSITSKHYSRDNYFLSFLKLPKSMYYYWNLLCSNAVLGLHFNFSYEYLMMVLIFSCLSFYILGNFTER